MRCFFTSCLIVSSFAFASTALADDRVGCTVGSHPGIDDVDAETTADLVCHELASHGETGPREIRMGKLGGRILLVVDRHDGTEDRRILLSGLDEVPSAATRIATAGVEGKPVADAELVDHVVGDETRRPKGKPGQMGFKGGIIGAMPVGIEGGGAAPGIALGLLYRANRFALDGHLRVGGGGGTTTTLSHVVLGTGPQYYFTDGDFSPYVGAGVGIMSFKLSKKDDTQSVSGTGFGGYIELGVEALRTHHATFVASVRLDIPAYSLKDDATSSPTHADPVYVTPASLMVGMIFH